MTWPVAETTIDVALVRGLVGDQFPELAHLDCREVAEGFDNSLWRLGDDLVARLPRRAVAAELLANEVRWLGVAAAHVSLATPLPLRAGSPSDRFAWPWSIGTWIDGAPGDEVDAGVRDAGAGTLATFLREMHAAAPHDAPRSPVRGVALATRDATFTENLHRVDGHLDEAAVRALWSRALDTPPFDGPPRWLHGDPHPGNMVYCDGALVGVVDFGDLCAGDPATDLAGGFLSLSANALDTFVDAYGGLDEGTLWRTIGWATYFGVMMTSLGLTGRPSYYLIGRLAADNATAFARRC
jgi:aminoglycoside phosphotransferase (APT) family kinase protein